MRNELTNISTFKTLEANVQEVSNTKTTLNPSISKIFFNTLKISRSLTQKPS